MNLSDDIKSISKKGLSLLCDCTPSGRKLCQGKCCTSRFSYGRYFLAEIQKLPEQYQKMLRYNPKTNQYDVYKQNPDTPCPFLQLCFEHQEFRPLQCQLWPLRINKSGKLILFCFWTNLHCPCSKKGKPAWISLEPDLRALFGNEWYEKLKAFMATDLPDEAFETFPLKLDKWVKK